MKTARVTTAVVVVTMSLLGSGCGLKFINSAVNLPVPPTLQERTLFKDTSIIQYDLELLSGYVLERERPDSLWNRRKQILPAGFQPTVKPIPEGEFYHSIVDNQIAASGGATIPILSIASSLKVNQRMELTITDAALVVVPDKDIPWTELASYAQAHQLPPGSQRVWVQAVMLTKLMFNQAVETNADATVSGGAYKVDGKVYNHDTSLQRQPYLTMLLIDVNELVRQLEAAGGRDAFVQKMLALRSLSGSPLRFIAVENKGISF